MARRIPASSGPGDCAGLVRNKKNGSGRKAASPESLHEPHDGTFPGPDGRKEMDESLSFYGVGAFAGRPAKRTSGRSGILSFWSVCFIALLAARRRHSGGGVDHGGGQESFRFETTYGSNFPFHGNPDGVLYGSAARSC